MNTILVSIFLGVTAFNTTFDAGLTAYNNDNYPESIARFEELVYNRVYEPEVFYNLGNAYYRQGLMASAIVNYERALRVDPTLSAAQDNLNRSVGETLRALPRPATSQLEQALYFWHGGFSQGTSKTIGLLFWVMGWLILSMKIVWPRPYIRRTAGLILAIAVLFLGSWQLKAHPSELAVAISDKIPVRYGTKSTDTVRFELYSGDRVHIDQHRDEWVRVNTADGQRGWTRSEYFIGVWPPQPGEARKASSGVQAAKTPTDSTLSTGSV